MIDRKMKAAIANTPHANAFGVYLDGDPIDLIAAGRVLDKMDAGVTFDHLEYLVTSGALPVVGKTLNGRPLVNYGDVLAFGLDRSPKHAAMLNAVANGRRPAPVKSNSANTATSTATKKEGTP